MTAASARMIWHSIGLFSAPFALASCSIPSDPHRTMYVIVGSDQAASFTNLVGARAELMGFTTQAGDATDDQGHTLYALEGHRGLVRLWVQNEPIDGDQGPRCASMRGLEVDPRQYVVDVEPRFPLIGGASANEAFSEIRSALKKMGYAISGKPLACSALAKAD